jgi:hypothetical protein
MFQVGGLAAGRLEEQDGREVELTTEMVGDPDGDRLVLDQEPLALASWCAILERLHRIGKECS